MEPEANDIEVEEVLPPPKPPKGESSGIRQRYILRWNDDGTYRLVQVDPTSGHELTHVDGSNATVMTLAKEEVFKRGGALDSRDRDSIFDEDPWGPQAPGEWWNPRAYL